MPLDRTFTKQYIDCNGIEQMQIRGIEELVAYARTVRMRSISRRS